MAKARSMGNAAGLGKALCLPPTENVLFPLPAGIPAGLSLIPITDEPYFRLQPLSESLEHFLPHLVDESAYFG
jgi:hypothetical protein